MATICVKINGNVLLEGPLHGKVIPSESSWSLMDRHTKSIEKDHSSQSLQLSLHKGYQHQDIWATVFDRTFLSQALNYNEHSEEYTQYDEYLQNSGDATDVSYVDVAVHRSTEESRNILQ